MRKLVSETGYQFWERPGPVIKPHKTGDVVLLHAPIGKQLFHSRPYGPLFDLSDANEETIMTEREAGISFVKKPVRSPI
jgi:hypothetical protein